MSRRAEERAIRHAWLLARAHGHHWACVASATPEALAYGRALLATCEAGPGPLFPDHPAWEPLAKAEVAFCDAVEREWEARSAGEAPAPIPPRTVEEAEALSALPSSGPFAGLGFDYAHRTGSGRLGWEVDPATGGVTITVYRPGDRACLTVQVRGDLRRMSVEPGPAPLRCRHVEAANDALRALGLPILSPADPGLADDAGRTPAFWDAVEGVAS